MPFPKTFDLEKSERRKESGMSLAPLPRKQLLELAREYAAKIARRQGWVTYDDVFFELLSQGVNPITLGNAAGCVFHDKEFIFTGRWEKSRRISNHARMNRVWMLREGKFIPRLV